MFLHDVAVVVTMQEKINHVFIIISGWFKIQSNLERVRIMPFRCIENPALNSRAVC